MMKINTLLLARSLLGANAFEQKQLDGADGIVLDNAQQWLYFPLLNKK
jgi:hypothetical protein|tara:strand:+ start:24379 stop:24522 length:144 start_codon:yes stop_codon:yes gene_type:complete